MRAFCRTTLSLRLLMTLLAFLGIGLHTAWAQINEWTRVGWFEGGSVQQLIIDPQNPNTVYATNAAAGIFKSTDGGASISALAVDSREPNTFYAVEQNSLPGRVVKTTDRGTTWSLVNSAGNIVTTGLAVDPRDGSVYAGTNEALFRSVDGGTSWTLKSGRLGERFQERQFLSLAIDPQNPNTVYVGTAGSGVFKSTDSGTSWRAVNSGISASIPFWVAVLAVAVDPKTPGTVYASTTSTGLIQSTDGGASWNSANFGLEANAIRALAMDPKNPNTLFAGTSRGLFMITFATQRPILIDSIQFDQASVRVGDSYIARASGTNLTAQTYFDIRYRAPDSTVDEEALNWQTGTAAVHGVTAGIGLGTWIVMCGRMKINRTTRIVTSRLTQQ